MTEKKQGTAQVVDAMLASRLNAALQGLLHIQQLAAHADENASPYYQIREAARQVTRSIQEAFAIASTDQPLPPKLVSVANELLAADGDGDSSVYLGEFMAKRLRAALPPSPQSNGV